MALTFTITLRFPKEKNRLQSAVYLQRNTAFARYA